MKQTQRFFRAFCIDCNRYLLQSFDEADVDKMALLHGQICNHETFVDEQEPRRSYES